MEIVISGWYFCFAMTQSAQINFIYVEAAKVGQWLLSCVCVCVFDVYMCTM